MRVYNYCNVIPETSGDDNSHVTVTRSIRDGLCHNYPAVHHDKNLKSFSVAKSERIFSILL